jgi:hypothetical protein
MFKSQLVQNENNMIHPSNFTHNQELFVRNISGNQFIAKNDKFSPQYN